MSLTTVAPSMVTGTALTSSSSISASSITTGTLPKAQLPAGTILQVVQTAKTDTFTTSSGSMVDITGLSVSITPTSATSKVYVSMVLYVSSNTTTANSFFNMVRNSTNIDQGTAEATNYSAATRYYQDNQTEYSVTPIVLEFLDSPATTSATTYKIQTKTNAGTMKIGAPSNAGGMGAVSFPSIITVMEVAA